MKPMNPMLQKRLIPQQETLQAAQSASDTADATVAELPGKLDQANSDVTNAENDVTDAGNALDLLQGIGNA